MPITIGGLAAGAIGTGLNLYNSYEDRKRAQKQLDELNKQPIPQYAATPELMNYYGQASNEAINARGLSGGEKAAFNNNVANNVNTIYRNAANTSGGNMSRFLRNAINASIVSSSNQLVGQDAALKRANRQSALSRQAMGVNALQGISDRNVAAKQMRQQLIAQALGGSISQQSSNIAGAYNNIGNLGLTAAGYGLSQVRSGSESGGSNNGSTGITGSPNTNYFRPARSGGYKDVDYQDQFIF